ncbi:MAG: type I pullulanase [Bacteroidetes bacterium GWC2_40_13]|nr:MAG: type I pullulanase [Bacteroidetes bacterium GWC2_40_13]
MKIHQFVGMTILTLFTAMACNQTHFDSKDPSTYPVYEGFDLGTNYTKEQTVFKLWAPTAQKVAVRLYEQGVGGDALKTIELSKGKQGVWDATEKGDLNGTYFTFQVQVDGKWLAEVPGPYATAVGVNGKRAMIIDLEATNPEGWQQDVKPALAAPSDVVLYELHVRDFSIHANSGMQHKGKFLAMTEPGTKTLNGMATGIDHLKEMGVTHVHLLPAFDYRSIDESQLDKPRYNWGYDPQNYNVPEGSYATDPYNGNVRIQEFKQMVMALHQAGIRVVLDVVYNHVGNINEQSFEQTVPGYYFRHNTDSSLSNASGCGNETASERFMMRKYMIESVLYWAFEYHLDGFRFDLMGIHDINTMNLLAESLHDYDSSLFIYGEGWTAGDSPLPVENRAIKQNMPKIYGVAAFSDEFRDGIKGHWNNLKTKGFVSGEPNMEESVKFGIVAATQHPQVDYKMVNYSDTAWSKAPAQTINYVSCHDNNTLWDKLAISSPESTESERIRMDKLANTIVFTSQGVPFLHAGEEFLRTKRLVENSFESPDSINWIDWSLKEKNSGVVEYYKGLIAMRKAHPAFKMPTAEMIASHLEFMDLEPGLVVGYTLSGNANGDSWKEILVIFNANKTIIPFELGDDEWHLGLDIEKGYQPEDKSFKGDFKLAPISAYVFYRE